MLAQGHVKTPNRWPRRNRETIFGAPSSTNEAEAVPSSALKFTVPLKTEAKWANNKMHVTIRGRRRYPAGFGPYTSSSHVSLHLT